MKMEIFFIAAKIFKICFVAFVLLMFNPFILGSETLVLTTYYPAPYGGYARLLTTDETALARDNTTSRVVIGENDTAENDIKMVVRGGILKLTDSSIPVNQNPPGGNAGGFANRLWIQNLGGSYILMSRDVNNFLRIGIGSGDPNIVFTGNLNILNSPGRIIGLCTLRPYPGSCGANETVLTHYGDGAWRSIWFVCRQPTGGQCLTPSGAANWTFKAVGWDWAGQMLCCRIAWW